jgi:hypothetical protein
MDLKMGSQVFRDVSVPLLWGTRAVVQDRSGRISVIDLSGTTAKLEILGDKPAPRVKYRPLYGQAVEIFDEEAIYIFDPERRSLQSVGLKLPECRIEPNRIWVGTNLFQNNRMSGFGVGIHVHADGGVSIGGPLPAGLAKLKL